MAAAPGASEIGDRRKAIETAIKALEPGDVLLIAGKGHEDYQIVGTTKHHFSDHEVVAETSERPLMQPLWTVAEAVAATGGRPESLSDGPLHVDLDRQPRDRARRAVRRHQGRQARRP